MRRASLALLATFLSGSASAETLESALARAYGGNPTLGAQRASVRATDENVPRAKSLGRPRVSATADIGAQYSGRASRMAAVPRRPPFRAGLGFRSTRRSSTATAP